MTARRRIDPAAGRDALAAWTAAQTGAGEQPDRRTLAAAVRYSLEELSAQHPGGSVEVRVPPFGVAQAIDGPQHRRGTPPNVVESDPATWLRLVTGAETFAAAVADGRVLASGTRADLGDVLPLV